MDLNALARNPTYIGAKGGVHLKDLMLFPMITYFTLLYGH